MESRIILNKLLLLGYIAFSEIGSKSVQTSVIVLLLLLYFSINMTIPITKWELGKKSLVILSMVFIGVCFVFVDSFFIILLPINLYEYIVYYIRKKWIVLALTLLPVLFVTESDRLIYVLVSVFSFLVFVMEIQAMQRLENYEVQNDRMRIKIQKLQKQLHDNDEYIKQSKYTFQLEERNRLSQDIHDKIGHSMTSALIQMEAAKSLLVKDREKSNELLQNAINISKDGIEKIRVTLKDIKPATQQMGIQRIRLFLDDFTAKQGLQTSLLHKGDVEMISPLQWKVIYENIRESLTNTMKYANASVVSIEIHVLNRMLKVEVKDNGTGSSNMKKGIGISGMEERIASINGTIIVDGSNGFSVTMLFPLP
ncbi:sensor histidine kinase [Shimazuella kribbensis]|uniref:sensor histidine kinase n=1 Tax=Shimazuella kribbensis TaxID=139808 RepID=UPI00048E8359|nr:sensor histidine kinase [Shimazuella kribbensis]